MLLRASLKSKPMRLDLDRSNRIGFFVGLKTPDRAAELRDWSAAKQVGQYAGRRPP